MFDRVDEPRQKSKAAKKARKRSEKKRRVANNHSRSEDRDPKACAAPATPPQQLEELQRKRGSPSGESTPSPHPFPTDYGDHFETPRIAYEHLAPVLRLIAQATHLRCFLECCVLSSTPLSNQSGTVLLLIPNVTSVSGLLSLRKNLKKKPRDLVVYDPFFCAGAARQRLEAVGFSSVIHENVDFYERVRRDKVPSYDVLVSNPPYSQDHKVS